MSANSHYIYLPSNDLSYPDNKQNKFRVRLPIPLNFDHGTWLCGLTSIQYPRTWATISATEEQYMDMHMQDGYVLRVPFVTGGQILTSDQLVKSIERGFLLGFDRQNRSRGNRKRRAVYTWNGGGRRKRDTGGLKHVSKIVENLTHVTRITEDGEPASPTPADDAAQSGAEESLSHEEKIVDPKTSENTDNSVSPQQEPHSPSAVEDKTPPVSPVPDTHALSGEQDTHKHPSDKPDMPSEPKSPHHISDPPASPEQNGDSSTTEKENKPPPTDTSPNLGPETAEEPAVPSEPKSPHHIPDPPASPELNEDSSTAEKENKAPPAVNTLPNADSEPAEEPVVPTEPKSPSPSPPHSPEPLTDPPAPSTTSKPLPVDANEARPDESQDSMRNYVGSVRFILLEGLGKFQLRILSPNIAHVQLSKQLEYVMGFEESGELRDGTIAKYSFDITGGINHLCVYSSGLMENMIVGNTLSSLLRIVAVGGSAGGAVEKIYDAPIYNRVVPKHVSDIDIEIRDLQGRLIPFDHGVVILTLHFKKAIYF